LKIYCHTINELQQVTKKILNYGKDFKVWVLKGELGAGKTTFIKEITKQLGIKDQTSSPSYALVNEYRTKSNKRIYHLDLFRINTTSEALDIGIDEYLDSDDYCFIEWPEIIESLLPSEYLEVCILNPVNDTREFNIKKHE
jgi:tRNA threonylcarbamoyladenosine biosynthesis protein TsaE